MLVKTGIFGEAFAATRNGTDVWALASVNSNVVPVVSDAREGLAAALHWTLVGSLARVRANVNLADVTRREALVTTLERTQEWPLPFSEQKP